MVKLRRNMKKFYTFVPWGHAPIVKKKYDAGEEERKKDVDISLYWSKCTQ